MSDTYIQNRTEAEKAEKPDSSSVECVSGKQESLFSKAIIEQMVVDPVEKGPFLTVDNSPRSGRNVSVIKAKLREQESRHTLDLIRIKTESEVEKERMSMELAELNKSLSTLQEMLNREVDLRKDAVRHEEQTSKDLLVISQKCAELQGRLDESHAALKESRDYNNILQRNHETNIAELKKDFAETDQRRQDVKRDLERKIRELEDVLSETRSGFKKALTAKIEQWKRTEAEFEAYKKQQHQQYDKLSGENNAAMSKVEQMTNQLLEAGTRQEALMSELNELRDNHTAELLHLREDNVNNQREWNERMENVLTDLRNVQEELNETRSWKDAAIVEKENTILKNEESVKVLKDALTVLDDQNKELTLELKRMQDKCEEKESISATLASQVNALVAERNEVQSEQQILLQDKSRLEEELVNRSQTTNDIISQKDLEICNLQGELLSVRGDMALEIQGKDAIILDLEVTLEKLNLSMEDTMQIKDDQIRSLSTKLEESQNKVISDAKDIDNMQKSMHDQMEQLDRANVKYEGCQQQISKLNLEMKRLINEVVNIKEENIELKSGITEALQKGEFYKDRNFSLTEQLAEQQRDKADREAELLADIEEKKDLIEYLQNQMASAVTSGSEKKKRRFFQSKTIPSSPMKENGQKAPAATTLKADDLTPADETT